MELTPLENDIIRWLYENCEDGDLQKQLSHVILRKRDYTGVGFFLHFCLPPEVSAAGDSTPICGPEIASPELAAGAGTIVFLTDGWIDCIEIFAYEKHFPEIISNYAIS